MDNGKTWQAIQYLHVLNMLLPTQHTQSYCFGSVPSDPQLLLLLLGSPSNTLLECRSNQRICPKTDSHVSKCGVPWLPLIESGDEPNGPGKSQGHCGRIPQISWVAHSSISSFHSQLRTFLKDMINRLLTLPTPTASRVNLWAETTLKWAEGQMMPTSQASKMHSFLSMQVCLIWIHRWWGLFQKSVRRCIV